MSIGLSLALLCAAAGPTSGATLRFSPRVPAVAVVVTPFGQASTVGASALIDALATALEARTNLAVRSAEQVGVDVAELLACPADRRLSCWAQTIRPARHPAEGDSQPVAAHLFVLSARALSGQRDRVSVTWIDLERAAAASQGALPDQDLEDRLFADAFHARPRVTQAKAVRSMMQGLLEDRMHDRLQNAGLLLSQRQVILRHQCSGCVLVADGRTIGPLVPGEVRLLAVPQGPRSFELHRAGAPLTGCAAQHDPGTRADLELDFMGCEAAARPSIAPALRWTGVAMITVGAVLSGIAIQRAAASPDTICLAGGCQGLGLATVGFDTSPPPTADRSTVNPGGPAWAAMGGGAAAAGVGLVAGSYLVPEEQWWWSPVAGLVLGATTFGIVSAVGAP